MFSLLLLLCSSLLADGECVILFVSLFSIKILFVMSLLADNWYNFLRVSPVRQEGVGQPLL